MKPTGVSKGVGEVERGGRGKLARLVRASGHFIAARVKG